MSLVPFDDRDGVIWMDGAMVPWREAKLHVLSHGLHYASGVFEGERSYSGNVFKLREHTDRLIASGRILGFEIPYSAEQIDAACREHHDPPGHRLLGLAQPVRRRPAEPHEGRAPGQCALEAPAPGNRADRRQGRWAVYDRHPVQARRGGRGL